MIERALARTFRSYSTLFVVVAILLFPVHLTYTYVFRNVIATSDFHEAIEAGPKYRQVRSVGSPQIDHSQLVFWIVVGVELAALPLAIRAGRRVFAVADEGGVPTAPDAWTHAFQRTGGMGRPTPAAMAVGLGAAVGVGVLAHLVGSQITDFLSEDWRWTGVGVTQAVSRSAAAPFLLGAFSGTRAKEAPPTAPKLY